MTKGGLVQLLTAAAKAAPAYRCEQVRRSPVVTPDESVCGGSTTGCGCSRRRRPRSTRATGGGSSMRRRFSAPTSPACWCGTVGWPIVKNAPHQTCVGHLLRRCENLQVAHPDSPWADRVQAVLQDGLALRDRCNARHPSTVWRRPAADWSPGSFALGRGRASAKHLANEFPAVFLFLCDPSIDATNWRAEQPSAPRWSPARCAASRKGADTQQVLASVTRTARQRRLDPRRCSRAPAHRSCPICRHPPDRGPLGSGIRRPSSSAATAPPATPGAAAGPPPADDVPGMPNALRAASLPRRGPRGRRRQPMTSRSIGAPIRQSCVTHTSPPP